ncbi:MAG: putative toxin-antitoxin system toxin component, PIN family [Sphingobacteriales bacterium]
MNVVIDCNIFVMCLTSNSPYHFIFRSLVNGEFNLAVTADILLEYEEVLQQKYSAATAKTFVTLLNELPNVDFIHTYFHWQLMTIDMDDNKYCDCAVSSQASYIVTEDRHFDILKTISFPSLTAIRIDAFMDILKTL